MRNLQIGIVVTLLALATAAHAGLVVRGTVRDAATGEGLAAATVQVEGTFRGTIANGVGEYALEVDALPATLHVTYIGYASMARTVTEATVTEMAATQATAADTTALRLDFDLVVAPYRLPEMVVSPTLGADLMHKVIAHKAEWLPRLRSYRAEAYTRRTIDRTGDIIEMSEVVSDIYWDRERGTREVVTSTRKTANSQENEFASAMEGTVNLYDDDVEFIESSLMGVTHPDALEHYDFEVVGRRWVDDRVVYDLSVRPKSRLFTGFEGTVAILDGEFVLLEVDLAPTKAVLATAIPVPMIEDFTWHYRQQFRGFDGLWLPVDYRLDLSIEIGMVGLQFPVIGMQQVTRFADYDIDAELPDSLFTNQGSSQRTMADVVVRVDSAAVAADTAFTRFADPVPMTAAETAALDTITAGYTAEKALKPSGFLVRFIDFDEDDGGGKGGDDDGEPGGSVSVSAGSGSNGTQVEAKAAGPKRRWKLADWTPEGRYDRVEEVQLGLRAKRQGPLHLELAAGLGYSTGLERYSVEVGGGRDWSDAKRRELSIHGGWRRGAAPTRASVAYPELLNTAQVLLGEGDYFDYLWREGLYLDVGVDPQRWQATARLGLRAERHSSLASTTTRDLLGRPPLRPNPPIDAGRMRRLELGVEVGDSYSRFGVEPMRRLAVELEHSAGWMGSDFDYSRVRLEADWHTPTFLQRRWVPNALDLALVAGAGTEGTPVQRFGVLDVAMGPLSPWGVLRGARGDPYVGQRYLGLLAEHNFRTVPFERLGLWPLVRRGFGLVAFGGTGQTWIDADRCAAMPVLPRGTHGPHEEVGASLFLYHIVRVDLTRRLDESGWAVGASMARFEFD